MSTNPVPQSEPLPVDDDVEEKKSTKKGKSDAKIVEEAREAAAEDAKAEKARELHNHSDPEYQKICEEILQHRQKIKKHNSEIKMLKNAGKSRGHAIGATNRLIKEMEEDPAIVQRKEDEYRAARVAAGYQIDLFSKSDKDKFLDKVEETNGEAESPEEVAATIGGTSTKH